MNVKIKDIPQNERPRERLIKQGVKELSNEDLLTLLIKDGTKTKSAKIIALELLKMYDNITGLKNITISKLKQINGIGDAKASLIIAAIELGNRIYHNNPLITEIKFNDVTSVFNYYKNKIERKQECFYAVYLDNKNKILTDKLLFIGTINASLVHPREIFKEAYLLSAAAIICIHNHPSGDTTPSDEDLTITEKLVSVGILLGIKILDHIIIGKTNYYSFLENGHI